MRKHFCSVSSIILRSTAIFQSERRLEDGLLSCCTYPEKDALDANIAALLVSQPRVGIAGEACICSHLIGVYEFV